MSGWLLHVLPGLYDPITGAKVGSIDLSGREQLDASSPGSGGTVEAANLAAFPATGNTAMIYAALDTNKLYIWTGSAYVEASGLPANSDVVAEGATNLYYTPARAALKANAASPAFSGAVSGTFTLPVTATAGSTPGQADNSTKLATTAYVDALGATKVTANAAVALTGANTLTQAAHFNRHNGWTGGTTAAQAVSATASEGDLLEVSNDGTAAITFTGVTAGIGYRNEVSPGETFYALYTGAAWKSLTPSLVGSVPMGTDITASRALIAADFLAGVIRLNHATVVIAIAVPTVASMGLPATPGRVHTLTFLVEGAAIPTFAGATASTTINGTAGTTTVFPGSWAGTGGAAPARGNVVTLMQRVAGGAGDDWILQ